MIIRGAESQIEEIRAVGLPYQVISKFEVFLGGCRLRLGEYLVFGNSLFKQIALDCFASADDLVRSFPPEGTNTIGLPTLSFCIFANSIARSALPSATG